MQLPGSMLIRESSILWGSKMSADEKKLIERELEKEQRTMQRQALLKQLSKLSRKDPRRARDSAGGRP